MSDLNRPDSLWSNGGQPEPGTFLRKEPYTGCNPRPVGTLTEFESLLERNKTMSKDPVIARWDRWREETQKQEAVMRAADRQSEGSSQIGATCDQPPSEQAAFDTASRSESTKSAAAQEKNGSDESGVTGVQPSAQPAVSGTGSRSSTSTNQSDNAVQEASGHDTETNTGRQSAGSSHSHSRPLNGDESGARKRYQLKRRLARR